MTDAQFKTLFELLRIVGRYISGYLIFKGADPDLVAVFGDPQVVNDVLGVAILVATEFGWVKSKMKGTE